MKETGRILLGCVVVLGTLLSSFREEVAAQAGATPIRVGHFATLAHAPAVIAHEESRAGAGRFESRLGAPVEWSVYTAGPSAMEALIGGSIDLAFVGPSPLLNAAARARPGTLEVLAGVTRGGSGLVVGRGSGIRSPLDLRGMRLATPQLGNTQDVSARAWLRRAGLAVTLTGGDVFVVPTRNADQLPLFRRGEVAAVWTSEPWLSQLVEDGAGEVLVDEGDAISTLLVARREFSGREPETTQKFREVLDEILMWLRDNPSEAQQRFSVGLVHQAGGAHLKPNILAAGWRRLKFSSTVTREDLAEYLQSGRAAGFLRREINLATLFAPTNERENHASKG